MTPTPDTPPEFTAGWRAMRDACFRAGLITYGSGGFSQITNQHAMLEFLRGAREFAGVYIREPKEQT